MKKLEVSYLNVSFDGKDIVKDINIHINEGELVSIIGPSGSGKTTIFNAITGILNNIDGKILLNGEDITNKTGKISYMLQDDLLLPFKKIIDNIALPLVIKGIKKQIAYEKIYPLANIFGLSDLLNKYPKELSGGQKQRVALLRTLMFSDEIHLLDEPFSALDLITKESIHKWYIDLRKKLNISTLLITHDIDEAILLSDRIYILEKNDNFASIKSEFKISLKEDTTNVDDDFIAIKKKILNELK